MSNLVMNFFNEHNLDLQNKTIVVGVSTGVDSMVLLDELLNAQNEVDFKIVVAHVNHQVRKQSFQEEKFIIEFCKNNNLEIKVKRLLSDNINHNFQDAARKFRYEFFSEVIDEYKAQYLLLAHHANDNIETIMMRILRGSNLRGYAGIDAIIKQNNYFIIRPLINVLKTDILDIAGKRKLVYFEDETNSQMIYTRNRIREEIVTTIFKENENAHKQFMHFANIIRDADEEIKKNINSYIHNNIKVTDDFVSFDRNLFLQQSIFLQKEILFTITKDVNLGSKNVEEILKLLQSDKPNIITKVTKGLTFVREYDRISLYFKEIEFPDIEILIEQYGEYEIDEKRKIVVLPKNNDKNILKNNSLWYNRSMLPITVRTRKEGDKIELIGGTKKVSDLLIDKKIGILEREKILLVEDKDGQILSVLGLAKSKQLINLKQTDMIIMLKEK